MRGSRTRLAAGIVVALLLVGPAIAWACTMQAEISLSPRQGPAPRAGQTTWTTVSGTGFGTEPVEIHWNDASGPLLATAHAAPFSVQVAVPAGTSPGVYYLVATTQATDTSSAATASASFEVTPRTTATGGGGGDTTGTQEPSASSGSASGGGPGGPASTSGSASGGGVGIRGSGSDSSEASFDGASGSDTPGAGIAAPASADRATTRPAVVSPAAASTTERGASLAPVAGSSVAGDPSSRPGGEAAGAVDRPSARTAAGDLWSGLEGGTSLAPAALDGPGSRHADNGGLALGLGLIAVAIVALSAVGAEAGARRRKVTAHR